MARHRYTQQERAWGVLYDRIQEVLRRLGSESAVGAGDYWLLDDNWGPAQHKLYINNLKLLAPETIKELQGSLLGYQDWEIVVAIDALGPGESWPEMGLIIRPREIVDELRREYFPPEFQNVQYEGSRRGPPAYPQ